MKTYEVTLEELADLVVVASHSAQADDATGELVRRCWAELAVIDRQLAERAFERFIATLPPPATALAVAESIVNTKESNT